MKGSHSQTTTTKKNNHTFLFILCAVILFFFAVQFFRAWTKSREINQEIGQMQTEIESLREGNIELSELTEYLNTSAYIEEKARSDLGLKKEGERIVIVPESVVSTTENLSPNDPHESNIRKWWRLFFSLQRQ